MELAAIERQNPNLHIFWSDPFLNLQITRKCMITLMSSNFGQIGMQIIDLAALEHPKITSLTFIG